MSRTKMFLTVLCTAHILAACSIFDPFIDRRREAGVDDLSKLYVGRSTPDNPAVCYNKLITTFDEVKEMADEECEKHNPGTRAVVANESTFTCRILIPNHLYFRCVEIGKEE